MEEQLRRVLEAAYAARGAGAASVTLVLMTDARIHELNQQHLQHDCATDVLAFGDGEIDPDSGETYLGDILVSVDTAGREAEARNLQQHDEVCLYALHGLLHLLGMRDDTPEGRVAMIAAQREEFARHGLVFSMEDSE